MSFNVHTFYCRRCREATPHEMSEDGQRAECIVCSKTQRALALEQRQYTDTTRFIAALDGMGNRGEAKPTEPEILRARNRAVALVDRALEAMKGEQ